VFFFPRGQKRVAIDIEDYYRKFGPMVLRRCRQILRDEQAALDVMQDVFVQLLRRERQLTEVAPSSLLLCIATNLSLNQLRRARRKPEDRDDLLLQRIAAEKSDAEGGSLAGRILQRLFQGEQESTSVIAVLHFVDGLTLEEVAQEVGLSVSGVRKRIQRLRDKLAPEASQASAQGR
jgi:RNA polymerase sigma-70 factor (ECF subfamily)